MVRPRLALTLQMQPARLQLANAVVAFFRRPLSMSVPFHVTVAREKVGHAALREGGSGSGSGSGSWRRRWARPARLTIWPTIAASLSSTPHKPCNELRSCYLHQRLLTIYILWPPCQVYQCGAAIMLCPSLSLRPPTVTVSVSLPAFRRLLVSGRTFMMNGYVLG